MASSAVNLENIQTWVNSNLSNTLKDLRTNLAYQGITVKLRYSLKEKKLYRNPKTMSNWLFHIGLGKPKTRAPMILSRKDGPPITSPRELKKLVMEKCCHILRRGKSKPNLSGIILETKDYDPHLGGPRAFHRRPIHTLSS